MIGTCPRCGAPNQHGVFCQQCGASLAATGSPAPGAGVPDGTPLAGQAVPPGYQPPAYGATASGAVQRYSGAQPAHRLPLASILGVTIGLLGVIAAVAIVFGHHGSNAQPPYTPLSTVAPTATAVPSSAAVVQATSTVTAQPTSATQPTQAGVVPTQSGTMPTSAAAATATPFVQATQAGVIPTQAGVVPTQASQGSTQTLTTTTFTLQVPTSWQTVNQKTGQTQNEVVLEDPSTSPDAVDIYAGQAATTTTAQTALQEVLSNLQQQYADAKVCGNSQQSSIGGVVGTVVPICFTFTPQGGSALSAVDVAWAGTDQSGSYVYLVGMMAGESNQTFFTNASAVLQTLQWGGGQ